MFGIGAVGKGTPEAWHIGSVDASTGASTPDGSADTLGLLTMGVADVSKSVLDAIREGDWFFEPDEVEAGGFQATTAIPGTRQKLDVLAARARAGLPLWHERDRADYEEQELA